jgi:hypothetical protein
MKTYLILGIVLAGFATALLSAQTRSALGTPLSGITPVEFQEFRLGLDDFLEVEATEEGLGPAFNGTSCAVCHNIPTIGGAGTMAELRAGRRNASGEFETLNAAGDTLFHMFSVPGHGCQPVLPPDTNVFARRVPIPLFGAGLVEAISDQTLLALEDPQDRNGDGVSGRAGLVIDVETGERRVGRFGWKAQHATLITFGADAYRNEMGITNDLFPQESAFGITPEQMRLCDPFPGPRRLSRSTDSPARHRQLRELHALPGSGRAWRHQRPGTGGRADLRRNRLHRLPCAHPRDRTERQSALPSEDSRPVFRFAPP